MNLTASPTVARSQVPPRSALARESKAAGVGVAFAFVWARERVRP